MNGLLHLWICFLGKGLLTVHNHNNMTRVKGCVVNLKEEHEHACVLIEKCGRAHGQMAQQGIDATAHRTRLAERAQ